MGKSMEMFRHTLNIKRAVTTQIQQWNLSFFSGKLPIQSIKTEQIYKEIVLTFYSFIYPKLGSK